MGFLKKLLEPFVLKKYRKNLFFARTTTIYLHNIDLIKISRVPSGIWHIPFFGFIVGSLEII